MGGGGGLSLLPSPYPNLTYTATAKFMLANSQQTVQNTEYRIQIQNTETRGHKITNVPVFYMTLGLILMQENPGPLEGVGPENLSGSTLSMTLKIGFSRIKIITSCTI